MKYHNPDKKIWLELFHQVTKNCLNIFDVHLGSSHITLTKVQTNIPYWTLSICVFRKYLFHNKVWG